MAFTAGAMRPAGLFFGDTLPCFMAATGPLAFFGERFAFIGFSGSQSSSLLTTRDAMRSS